MINSNEKTLGVGVSSLGAFGFMKNVVKQGEKFNFIVILLNGLARLT